MSNDVMFLGGLTGIGKISGRPFYLLNFASPSKRDNIFGYEVANCYVDEDTFKIFQKSAKPGVTYPNIQVHYSRGGWDLISYKF